MGNPGGWITFTAVLTGLVGFWAGRASAPASREDETLRQLVLAHEAQLTELRARPAPSPPQGSCTTVATLSASDSAAIRAELARLVHEAMPTEAKAPTEEPRPHPPAAETSDPKHLAAIQETQRLVDSALAARRWTEQDAESLRLLASQLPEAQRHAVMRQLAMAVNEGRLRLDTRGPPF